MNKNIENYKKAIDQIHADENLKDKVLEKAKEKRKSKVIYYLSYAMSFTIIAAVAVVGINLSKAPKEDVFNSQKTPEVVEQKEEDLLANANVKKFSSNQELRDFLNDYSENLKRNGNLFPLTNMTDAVSADAATNETEKTSAGEDLNYSKTNNQVDSVDEADIVKTDGDYIYYCTNSNVYIADVDLNLKATVNEENISPREIFVNGEDLVVLGYKGNLDTKITNEVAESSTVEREYYSYRPQTFVNVYNLENIEEPALEREITIDGSYCEARMIDSDIYLVSTMGINYYDVEELEDDEILPHFKDSNVSSESKLVEATNISYFDELSLNSCVYTMIAGFDLNSNKEVNIETFLGNSGEIYVSENNMYIINTNYDNNLWGESSNIYKFALKDGEVFAIGNTEVKGTINNQFSADEYNGNLRIATTVYEYQREDSEDLASSSVVSIGNDYTTRLTIFDENLEKIGEIENLIEDEKIYSVRFIGDVGYIVTFESVDPLWVIDLSNPTNPVVKGELEIPGYSSYLHPWDENHIIGIGYDVKSNGFGGVTNDKIKLSMFDISDLENPKEVFKINLDQDGYTNVTYEHKALFVNKDKNLIGFPISIWDRRLSKTGFILYRVNLEDNKFEEISELVESGSTIAERAIYIGENIYSLFYNKIIKYDLNTLKEVKRLEINNANSNVIVEE